jgi:hypothetical protein
MAFFRSSRHLTALLRHCDKEEAILCELAECLSQDEDQAIVAEFMRPRAQCEIHAKFPRLKYLPKPLSAQMKPAAELARACGASSHR